MNTIKILAKAASSPLDVIKHEKVEERLRTSIILLLCNAALGSIIMPVIYYLNFKDKYVITLDTGNMVKMFCISILTVILACLSFSVISSAFKKKVSLKEIAASWGLSYIPNIICLALYTLTQIVSYNFISNSVVSFIVNTIFIMLLIWKVIFYFIEISVVLKLNGAEFFIATVGIGLIFIALMLIGFSVGIQVPVL